MFLLFFFLNQPAPPEIYPFPLHAALPTAAGEPGARELGRRDAAQRLGDPGREPVHHRLSRLRCHVPRGEPGAAGGERSEEHTSELQSLAYLVCRLLLEKTTERARAAGGGR